MPMATKGKGYKGYVLEHRLIMARHLGRCLQPWEVVHHKNGIRFDNRLENLEMSATIGEHSTNHNKGYRDGFIKGYSDGKDARIKALQAEIDRLRNGEYALV